MRPFTPLAAAVSLLVLLCHSPARAAQPLSVFLQGARSYGTANQERAAQSRRAEAGADLALGEILPALQLGASFTHFQRELAFPLPNGATITLQPHNRLEATVRLRVPLVDVPGYYRSRAADQLAKGAAAQARATQLEVDRDVAAAYFELAAAGALATSAKKSVESATENLRFVEDLFSAGRSTDLERQRALANLERAHQDEADAHLAIALSSRRLFTLTGVTPTAPTPPPADQLQQEAPLEYFLGRVSSSSSVAAARAATEAAGEVQRAARARWLPSLSGVAQEQVVTPEIGGHHTAYVLMVALDYRLDFTLRPEGRLRAAEVDVTQAQAEGVRRRVADAIHDNYRRVESMRVKCRAARAQAQAASLAAELAAARFQTGMATQLDVTQAQRDAFLADAARIQADATLAYARIALRLASNLPLPPSVSQP